MKLKNLISFNFEPCDSRHFNTVLSINETHEISAVHFVTSIDRSFLCPISGAREKC